MSLTYEYFLSNLGNKFSIVNGEIVADPQGLFTVSFSLADYTIYLNKLQKTFQLVAPKSSYLGRQYQFRYSDCITLITDWLKDNVPNSPFSEYYKKMKHKDFYKYYNTGMKAWFIEHNFLHVDSLEIAQLGDILIYAYDENITVHLGIYLTNNKILHHLPNKYSCVDEIDSTKVIGIYRCTP